MRIYIFVMLAFIGCFSLSSCVTLSYKKQEDKNVKAIGNGLIGPFLAQLNKQDQKKALESEYYALEHGKVYQALHWHSVFHDAKGIVTPGQAYQVGKQQCRQYKHFFIINHVQHLVKGSACRNDDGSWTPLD